MVPPGQNPLVCHILPSGHPQKIAFPPLQLALEPHGRAVFVGTVGGVFSLNLRLNSLRWLGRLEGFGAVTCLAVPRAPVDSIAWLWAGTGSGEVLAVQIEGSDSANPDPAMVLRGAHSSAVTSVAVHPFRALVASVSLTCVALWSSSSGLLLRTASLGKAPNSTAAAACRPTVAFHPDGTLVAASLVDGSVVAWEVGGAGEERFRIKVDGGAAGDDDEGLGRDSHPARLAAPSFAFTEDGALLVVAGGLGVELTVWEGRTGRAVRSIVLPGVSASGALASEITLVQGSVMSVVSDNGIGWAVDVATNGLLWQVDDGFAGLRRAPLGGGGVTSMRVTRGVVVCATTNGEGFFALEDDVARMWEDEAVSGCAGRPAPRDMGVHGSAASVTRRKRTGSRAADRQVLPLPPPPAAACWGANQPRQHQQQQLVIGRKSLMQLLAIDHCFPAERRAAAYRHLLSLPGTSSYPPLLRLGPHPSTGDARALVGAVPRRLARLASALAHWTPGLFGQPHAALGLAAALAASRLELPESLLFDILVTVATNHAASWFDQHPNPPMGYLGVVDRIVAESDVDLARHFASLGVGADIVAWPQLKGWYRGRLRRPAEWERFFDNLVARPPCWLPFWAAAVLIADRAAWLGVRDRETAEAFAGRERPLALVPTLRRADALMRDREHLVPDTAAPRTLAPIPDPGDDEVPLPVFTRYPHHVARSVERTRDAARLAEQRGLAERLRTAEVGRRVERVAVQVEQLKRRQQVMDEMEEQRTQQLLDRERWILEAAETIRSTQGRERGRAKRWGEVVWQVKASDDEQEEGSDWDDDNEEDDRGAAGWGGAGRGHSDLTRALLSNHRSILQGDGNPWWRQTTI